MQCWVFDEMLHWAGRPVMRCAVVAILAGCSSPAPVPSPVPAPVTLAEAAAPDNIELYRSAGFVVGSGAIPFVGTVGYAATEFLDSTAVLVALSVPPRSLSFVRAGDRYAAFYAMRLDLFRGDAIIRSERPTGEVRVASFAETTRGDEGVIFQRTMRVAPGAYALRITAQDSLGTGMGTATSSITVPAMPEGSIAPPMPVFMAEPRQTRNAALSIVANPRATVRYGRDSVLALYLESYGTAAPDTVIVTATRNDHATPLAADTIATDARRGPVRGARSSLAVYKLGLGPLRIAVNRVNGTLLDTLTAVVNLGLDMPVSSVSELIESLHYFASDADLQRLRTASASARPAQWAALVRRSDPNPATPDNEALLEYARRLRVAERLFKTANQKGWQTDRGAVVAALGEPDYMTQPQAADSLNSYRVITWEYKRHRLFLTFSDLSGPGRWRLMPFSDENFRALLASAGPCVGCR
jgi:GWxTD domain-containing protein